MERFTALKIFRNVVDLGSFAAASRHLGLSPAAVSKNVSELETHLGVRLLNRTTRSMSLTEAGIIYHAQVARLLDDLDAADSSLGPLSQTPKGVLRISAPVTLTVLTPLSRLIPAFMERYPEVSVELRLDDRRVNIVEEGFDLAIRAVDSLEDSNLVSRRLMRTRHVVCGAPSYFHLHGTPIEPGELTGHQCVQFTWSGHPNTWEFQRDGRSVRVPVDGRYKVTSSLAVRDALCAGFGLSLIPWVYVRKELEQGILRTVLDDWSVVDLSVYAIYPSRRHALPKVRAFVDFLANALAREGDTAAGTASHLM